MQQPQFQGVLWKRRDVFKNRWRPRWFVLQPSAGVLTYYLDDSSSGVHYDVVPRGTIYLRSCDVEADDHLSRPMESLYAFTITPPPSSLNGTPCFLAAASEQERVEWVENLRQVCSVTVEEEENSSDSVATPVPTTEPADDSEPEAEVVPWKNLEEEEEGPHGLLVNVPAQLASRIQTTLETNLPFCSVFKPEHGWKTLFENRHGVSSYERKYDSLGRTMIKSTALVNHPPKQILNLLIDSKRRRDYETNVQNDARLKRFNAHTFVDYYAFRPVWPTSARDFVAAVHWRVLAKPDSDDRAICVLGFSWTDDEAQEVPNNVRAELLVSLYLLEQVKEDDATKCRVTRVLSYDLGGSVPRSLTNTVLQQQAMMPSVISQHLNQTEPTPEDRLYGVLSNKDIIKNVIDPLFAEGEDDTLHRREVFAGQSVTDGKSKVVDSFQPKEPGSMDGSSEPSILGVAVWLLTPLFLWQVAFVLSIPGKEVVFLASALFVVRSVVLENAGRPCEVAGRSPVGYVTCRFSVDLKGVLRFIVNNKEEREDGENTPEISVIHIVVKAVAQAMSDVEVLSSRRVCVPLLGIDGYFIPRKSGIDISVLSAKHVASNHSGAIATVEDAASMSIQEIAGCLVEKGQKQQESMIDSRPSLMTPLYQLLAPPLKSENMGSCLVLATPDSDHCEVDLDVAPSPIHSGVNVAVVVGGVRLTRDQANTTGRRPQRTTAKPKLSVSLTIDCPVCDITTCRRFAERLQKLVQFPEMCED